MARFLVRTPIILFGEECALESIHKGKAGSQQKLGPVSLSLSCVCVGKPQKQIWLHGCFFSESTTVSFLDPKNSGAISIFRSVAVFLAIFLHLGTKIPNLEGMCSILDLESFAAYLLHFGATLYLKSFIYTVFAASWSSNQPRDKSTQKPGSPEVKSHNSNPRLENKKICPSELQLVTKIILRESRQKVSEMQQ